MQLRQTLARIGPRWRLAAAAVCLLLAAVSALDASAPTAAGAGTHPVVVAARDLPAGRALAPADLVSVRRHDTWPGARATADKLVSRTLAVALRRGEPVTVQRLLSPGLTRGLRRELVALPVGIASDVRALAGPGSRVDLLAVAATADAPSGTGPADGADRVADRLLVLASLPPETGSEGGCRLVLAVARDTAVRITGLRATRLFQVVTLPP